MQAVHVRGLIYIKMRNLISSVFYVYNVWEYLKMKKNESVTKKPVHNISDVEAALTHLKDLGKKHTLLHFTHEFRLLYEANISKKKRVQCQAVA